MKKRLIISVLGLFILPPLYSKTQRAVIVVSTGYDDDGKGKMAFKLAKKAQAVVRCQGGSEGGHAFCKGGKDFTLGMLPAGSVRKNVDCYLTAGMEVNLKQLFDEIEFLSDRGISTKGRLWISSRAHIVMPYHRVLGDLQTKYNKRKRYSTIGTRKGTGWCAADKRLKRGIRVADLLDESNFPQILKNALADANDLIVKVYGGKPLVYEDILKQYQAYALRLKPYVKDDVEMTLNKRVAIGDAVIFEGTGGTFFDVTLGNYPDVSSSATTASGICCGAGFGPSRVGHTVGVVRAYATCPNDSIPLPSVITDEAVIKKLKEATSSCKTVLYIFEKDGLPATNQDTKSSKEDDHKSGKSSQDKQSRKFGWLDTIMVKEAIWLNGIDSLAVTHLDHLDDLDTIFVCYDYVLNGKNIDYLPPQADAARKIIPRFMQFSGWKASTKEARKLSDLPERARHYIKKIEQLCGVPVSYVSVGPDSKQTILVNDLLPL